MSTSHSSIPPLQVDERATCMCEHGYECTSYAPGHAVHLIHARLASATPAEWIDTVVDATDEATGHLLLRRLTDASPITVWSAGPAARDLAPGTPVALHGRYHVLADGTKRINIRRE